MLKRSADRASAGAAPAVYAGRVAYPVPMPFAWLSTGSLTPRTYVCGYCSDKVGPNQGFTAEHSGPASTTYAYILICSSCGQPTFFDLDDRQWPGVPFGAAVAALPPAVGAVYEDVDWRVENHYVPPRGAGWADHIRGKSNDANHEIELIDQHSAKQVMSFVELLLKFIYEMPARVGSPTLVDQPRPT